MKDWDLEYLADAIAAYDFKLPPALAAECYGAISRMSKEIQRLQALVYLKPSEIESCGAYLMFRTDDPDNVDGIPCTIFESAGIFFLQAEECQDILTLDEQVRFQKVKP